MSSSSFDRSTGQQSSITFRNGHDSLIDDSDGGSTMSSGEMEAMREEIGFTIWNLFSPSWYLMIAMKLFRYILINGLWFSLFFWASLFTYIILYFFYIPSLTTIRPVHFQYDSSCFPSQEKMCKNPVADVQLSHPKVPTVFVTGQSYLISLDLEAPESEVNYHQGVFMVKMTLFDSLGREVATSSRPVMLTYRSYLVRVMITGVRSIPLVTGFMKESESINLPLIEDFVDGAKPLIGPVAKAKVELESRSVQVYWADLRIEANLTGLRYYMVHWPLSTAILGISVFFALYALITICSIDRSNLGDDDIVITSETGSDSLTQQVHQTSSLVASSLVTSSLVGDIDSSILSPDSTGGDLEVSSSEADSTTDTV